MSVMENYTPNFDTRLDVASIIFNALPKLPTNDLSNAFGVERRTEWFEWNIVANEPPTWSEKSVESGHVLIRDQQLQVEGLFKNLPDLKWEIAPAVKWLQSPEQTDLPLYPAFGEVVDVDVTRGRLLVRLLESPFEGPILLSFPDSKQMLNWLWLAQVGQGFEAKATLSATRPDEFYIGEFRKMVSDESVDPVEALRQRAEATHEFRF